MSNTYCDLFHRLDPYRRGTLSSSGNNGSMLDTVTTASATNSWSLDAVGNSTSTGETSRTFNSKNQITAISGLTTPTYDHDGNVTTDQAGNTYSYDAWNRLVFVNLPGLSTNQNYTYSAGGARPGISVCNGAVTTSYYSANWQDLEDDIVVTGECGSTTTKSTYLWSEAYIDELVARDTSVNGGSVTRTYAQQDANHDVTSLTNSSGTVLERFVYDPYGKQTVLNASWSTTSDSYNWVYGFQGGRLDPLTGLVNFRNRDLNPVTGTWMEQDPAGYIDGADLYKAYRSNPTSYGDPSGQIAIFIAGATRYFGDQYNSGVGAMYADPWFVNNIPGARLCGTHRQKDWFLDEIRRAKAANPNEPIILIGHSYGGGSVLWVAQKLQSEGINVDIAITIDPVNHLIPGLDHASTMSIPGNVANAANLYNYGETDAWGTGGNQVTGAANIGFNNTTHTTISEDPRVVAAIKALIQMTLHNLDLQKKRGYTPAKCPCGIGGK